MDHQSPTPSVNGAAATNGAARSNGTTAARRRPVPPILGPWLRAQSVNTARHAAALRPFRREEFENGAATPTEAHIKGANALLGSLRRWLLLLTRRVSRAAVEAGRAPTPQRLRRLLLAKERAHDQVRRVETVWDFYFELFGQRQSRFGNWLLSCDRIALDCYQHAYLGLGKARSIPAPPPFSYMRTGFSPATYRRGIPLRKLGRQLNPFPLIQLPYHRLVNPWTLGAVLHEVSHNLQNELGLADALPRAIGRRLIEEGRPAQVAAVWVRWNRETFADLLGLLLGGPAVVASLMDVVGRSSEATLAYSHSGPHPTPYLRTFLSIELLRRMGFEQEARGYRRAWTRLYPDPRGGSLPPALLKEFPETIALVVDTVCFRPYSSLGDKRLADVVRFGDKEQHMVEEAAGRIAAGTDPGIIPERFLIGAARTALDRRLARPGAITEGFYNELSRR